MKTGQANSVVVAGQEDLDAAPVIAETSKVTLNLTVNSDVANAHIVSGLPQKKGINPNTCQMYTEIKYVKSVSCVGHLSSVNVMLCYVVFILSAISPYITGLEALFTNPTAQVQPNSQVTDIPLTGR